MVTFDFFYVGKQKSKSFNQLDVTCTQFSLTDSGLSWCLTHNIRMFPKSEAGPAEIWPGL